MKSLEKIVNFLSSLFSTKKSGLKMVKESVEKKPFKPKSRRYRPRKKKSVE
jgi:hypothetical protein